jgi:hypothetical protein
MLEFLKDFWQKHACRKSAGYIDHIKKFYKI